MAEVPIGIKVFAEPIDGKHTSYTIILPNDYAVKLLTAIDKINACLEKYLATP